MILIGSFALLLTWFWLGSRYPQLIGKAHHVGGTVETMAYAKGIYHVAKSAPMWKQILFGSLNWLDNMKIGMTFGVLFGALLQTAMKTYPIRFGMNPFANTFKGFLLGVPMGVCTNCAVPAARGFTRAQGRAEVALGFLFASPNFNPVVIAMTIGAFPISMVLTKYALLLVVMFGIIPLFLRRNKNCRIQAAASPSTSDSNTPRSFGGELKYFASDLIQNSWKLAIPTLITMVVASAVSTTLILLIPWHSVLASITPVRIIVASIVAVVMPVPIALDVLFAANLHKIGVSSGYVMMFLTTLGTFSIVPAVYVWRDISKSLSITLVSFFCITAIVLAIIFK